jgi:hypothetical protein
MNEYKGIPCKEGDIVQVKGLNADVVFYDEICASCGAPLPAQGVQICYFCEHKKIEKIEEAECDGE